MDTGLTRIHAPKQAAALIKPQSICIAKFLTKEDWQVLNNAQYHAKVTCLSTRLRALGVQSLSEQSVKFGVAGILCTYKTLPDPSTIFQMVQDLKLAFVSSHVTDAGLPTIMKFPDDPRQLDSIVFSHCYQGSEGPANILPDQFHMVCKQVPLRKSNHQIDPKTTKAVQQDFLPPATTRLQVVAYMVSQIWWIWQINLWALCPS